MFFTTKDTNTLASAWSTLLRVLRSIKFKGERRHRGRFEHGAQGHVHLKVNHTGELNAPCWLTQSQVSSENEIKSYFRTCDK